LLQLCELELLDREKRAAQRRSNTDLTHTVTQTARGS
jgi:hypothetical protein